MVYDGVFPFVLVVGQNVLVRHDHAVQSVFFLATCIPAGHHAAGTAAKGRHQWNQLLGGIHDAFLAGKNAGTITTDKLRCDASASIQLGPNFHELQDTNLDKPEDVPPSVPNDNEEVFELVQSFGQVNENIYKLLPDHDQALINHGINRFKMQKGMAPACVIVPGGSVGRGPHLLKDTVEKLFVDFVVIQETRWHNVGPKHAVGALDLMIVAKQGEGISCLGMDVATNGWVHAPDSHEIG